MAWSASVAAVACHASRPDASDGPPGNAHTASRVAQILPEPRAPDDAIRLSMKLTNPGQEPIILLGPRTRHPSHPGVIPAGRHP